MVFDAIPFDECKMDFTKNFIFDAGNSIFNDDDIKRAYAEELYRITRPGYIENLKQKYNSQAQSYTQALKVEYDHGGLDVNWQRLTERQAFLNLWFTPPNPVKGAYSISGINPGDTNPVALQVELQMSRVRIETTAYRSQCLFPTRYRENAARDHPTAGRR